MPMLVCSDAEFNIEIDRLNVNYIPIERGRGEGKKEVPQVIRKLVASEAIAGVAIEEIRETYKVSPSSISAYKNGATSTASYNKPDVELAKNNREVKATISERAENVALEAIGLLTVEKIADCKAREIAGIARDMSAVIKDMNGDGGGGINNNIKVMIYQPQVRDESDFKTISIQE